MTQHNDSTFIDHLDELRSRIVKCVMSVLVLSVISYVFIEDLMALLVLPARGVILRFYFFAPHDAFLIRIKLALFSGILFSMPILFYQTWIFIQPALLQTEKKKLFVFTLIASVLFFSGAYFCYRFVLPVCIQFLIHYETPFLHSMIAYEKYLQFSGMLILAFGIIFLLPIFIYLLSVFGIVNAGALAVHRGYVLIVIFVLAAVITPPDIVTQFILAVPMYALFEISVFVVRQMEKRRNTKAKG